MTLKLNLTKRIAISLGLGLALARVAHADPAVTTRKALTLDGARELIAAVLEGYNVTASTEARECRSFYGESSASFYASIPPRVPHDRCTVIYGSRAVVPSLGIEAAF